MEIKREFPFLLLDSRDLIEDMTMRIATIPIRFGTREFAKEDIGPPKKSEPTYLPAKSGR